MADEDRERAVAREKEYWDALGHIEWVTERGARDVVALLPEPRGDVLELCSGSGTFTRHMPKTLRSYTCVDLSQKQLDSLKARLPGIIAVQCDVQALRFPEGSFDTALIFAGLHHVPDMDRAIANAFRVLRKEGTFTCFEPNAGCWFRIFTGPLKGVLKLYSEDEKCLEADSLRASMEAAGFRDIRCRYMCPEFNPEHLRSPLNKLFGEIIGLVSRLSPSPFFQPWFVLSGKKP